MWQPGRWACVQPGLEPGVYWEEPLVPRSTLSTLHFTVPWVHCSTLSTLLWYAPQKEQGLFWQIRPAFVGLWSYNTGIWHELNLINSSTSLTNTHIRHGTNTEALSIKTFRIQNHSNKIPPKRMHACTNKIPRLRRLTMPSGHIARTYLRRSFLSCKPTC